MNKPKQVSRKQSPPRAVQPHIEDAHTVRGLRKFNPEEQAAIDAAHAFQKYEKEFPPRPDN